MNSIMVAAFWKIPILLTWALGYNTFSMLSKTTKFILLINVKMLIIVSILTFINRINDRL